MIFIKWIPHPTICIWIQLGRIVIYLCVCTSYLQVILDTYPGQYTLWDGRLWNVKLPIWCNVLRIWHGWFMWITILCDLNEQQRLMVFFQEMMSSWTNKCQSIAAFQVFTFFDSSHSSPTMSYNVLSICPANGDQYVQPMVINNVIIMLPLQKPVSDNSLC